MQRPFTEAAFVGALRSNNHFLARALLNAHTDGVLSLARPQLERYWLPLMHVLAENTSVQQLIVDTKRADAESADDVDAHANASAAAAAAATATATQQHQQQPVASVAQRVFGDQGASGVSIMLRRNCTLHVLDLSQLQIGDLVCTRVGVFFSFYFSILNEEKTCNLLTEMLQGAQNIADALHFNVALRSCVLNDNFIGDDAAKSFGVMLAANAVLRNVELQNNRINDVGMQALAAGMATNSALFALKTEARSARRPSAIFLAASSDVSEAARASIAAKCMVSFVFLRAMHEHCSAIALTCFTTHPHSHR